MAHAQAAGRHMPERRQSSGRLSPADRQSELADLVLREGSVSPQEISEAFGVSLMTAHRDIDQLVRVGMVQKYYGGVTALPSAVFDSSIHFRSRSARAEKAAIARTAAKLVVPGMVVLLEDSTTTLALAHELAEVAPLTVITNFPEVVQVFKGRDEVRLIMLGGVYSPGHDAYLGLPCIDAVAAVRADIHFSSTSAMSTTQAFHSEQDVVLVKRAMMSASDRSVLLMDHHKIGRTALHSLAPLSDFTDLVVDDGTDGETLAILTERHPRLHVAPLSGEG
ncbi:MAG: DeoR/GlpR family DNA-binding transcription regulator [Protaetiibacter sp.]